MNPAQLVAHFDQISEAPDAIPLLRRFILDLAVRGKLVEQDPKDEPAAELLKRIQAKKARLVKEGEIRREQPLPPIEIHEVPVESPANWKWARLGDTSTLITKGSTPTSYGHAFVPSGINFIKVESIKNGRLLPENVTSFISEETNNFLARSRLAAGDILFSIAGSIGTCARVAKNILPANTNQALAIIRGTDLVFDAEFILVCIKSSIAHLVLAKARGGAMNNVSLDDIRNFVVPVPPLAEQHRIVARVDELMALCDRLEAAQAERESRRDRLAEASLQRLNQPADVDDAQAFREHARFHLNHLPRLTTSPEHISKLRQTILSLAVRGQLVSQDPNDEPASELLKRIQAEKERLRKEGEIERLDTFEPVGPNEIPISIPSGWEAMRMGWLARKLGAGSTPLGGKSVYQNEGIPFLRSQNVHNDGLRLDDVALISRSIHERMSGTHVQQQDILLNITGASIGRSALVPCTFIEGNVSQHVAIIRLFLPAIREFIHLSLTSPFFQKVIDDVQVGVSREGLSMQKLRLFPMLLPPLAEQHRIVAKVEELMALCDRLEAQLTTAQTESRRLLEAVLHEALAPPDGGIVPCQSAR